MPKAEVRIIEPPYQTKQKINQGFPNSNQKLLNKNQLSTQHPKTSIDPHEVNMLHLQKLQEFQQFNQQKLNQINNSSVSYPTAINHTSTHTQDMSKELRQQLLQNSSQYDKFTSPVSSSSQANRYYQKREQQDVKQTQEGTFSPQRMLSFLNSPNSSGFLVEKVDPKSLTQNVKFLHKKHSQSVSLDSTQIPTYQPSSQHQSNNYHINNNITTQNFNIPGQLAMNQIVENFYDSLLKLQEFFIISLNEMETKLKKDYDSKITIVNQRVNELILTNRNQNLQENGMKYVDDQISDFSYKMESQLQNKRLNDKQYFSQNTSQQRLRELSEQRSNGKRSKKPSLNSSFDKNNNFNQQKAEKSTISYIQANQSKLNQKSPQLKNNFEYTAKGLMNQRYKKMVIDDKGKIKQEVALQKKPQQNLAQTVQMFQKYSKKSPRAMNETSTITSKISLKTPRQIVANTTKNTITNTGSKNSNNIFHFRQLSSPDFKVTTPATQHQQLNLQEDSEPQNQSTNDLLYKVTSQQNLQSNKLLNQKSQTLIQSHNQNISTAFDYNNNLKSVNKNQSPQNTRNYMRQNSKPNKSINQTQRLNQINYQATEEIQEDSVLVGGEDLLMKNDSLNDQDYENILMPSSRQQNNASPQILMNNQQQQQIDDQTPNQQQLLNNQIINNQNQQFLSIQQNNRNSLPNNQNQIISDASPIRCELKTQDMGRNSQNIHDLNAKLQKRELFVEI
eukprot:403370942